MAEANARRMRISSCSGCSKKQHSQDQIHGKGKRAFIYSDKCFNRRGGWRCTVCGGEKE